MQSKAFCTADDSQACPFWSTGAKPACGTCEPDPSRHHGALLLVREDRAAMVRQMARPRPQGRPRNSQQGQRAQRRSLMAPQPQARPHNGSEAGNGHPLDTLSSWPGSNDGSEQVKLEPRKKALQGEFVYRGVASAVGRRLSSTYFHYPPPISLPRELNSSPMPGSRAVLDLCLILRD